MDTSNRKRAASGSVIDLMDSSESECENEVEIVKSPAVKKKAPPPSSAKTNDSNVSRKKAANQQREWREPLEVKQTKSNTAAKPQPQQGTNSSTSTKFNCATYNIWFNMQANPDERMMALAQTLLEQKNRSDDSPLLFIGFQEVTAALWATLKPAMESMGYRMFCQEEAVFGGHYGCGLAVLVREGDGSSNGVKIIQQGFQPYRPEITCQSRGFLHVRVQLPDEKKTQVLFTTTHLESFLPPGQVGPEKYTGSKQRRQQVQEMELFCHHHMKRFPDLSMAIISGDLNWDDERIQSVGEDKPLLSLLSSKEWTDTWFPIRDRKRQAVMGKNGKVKKKDEPTCFTYDAKENVMLGGSLRRRFDRILVRSRDGVNITVSDIALIGRDRIGDTTWTKESNFMGRVSSKVVPLAPSDHFGYVASLVVDGN